MDLKLIKDCRLKAVLTYAHACSRMLTYAHVCSRIQDLKLIKDCGLKAVESALLGISGVIGHDEDTPDLELRAIEVASCA